MAELQATDQFLVNRGEQTQTVEQQALMAELQDEDLLLINRANISYKITGSDLKESLGGKPIFPEPDEIGSNPPFQGGTGTELDPFLLQTIEVRPSGASGVSVETITIDVAGATEGDLVVWTDNSVGAGTRFTQPSGVVGADGTWSGKLIYTDSPETAVDTDYTGNLQIGEVYFRWIVEQGVEAIRPIDPTPDEITASPDFQGGSGTVGDPYILETQTCAPAGSSVSSVEEITITEVGAGAGEVVRWTVDNTRFTQPEGLTDGSGVWTGRLIYNDIPDTTFDQTYVGNLQIGTTYFRWSVEQKVLATSPPEVTNVSLVEANPAEGDRFTSQSFVASTQVTEGEPVSEKTFDAHVDGTLSKTVKFDEPLESSSSDGGEWIAGTIVGGSNVQLRGVAYGESRFVAVSGNKTNSVYSTDGINWTEVTTPTGSWYGVAYGDGTFVAVSIDGINDQTMYSTDGGVSWTSVPAPRQQNWLDVTYGETTTSGAVPTGTGLFVAVANDTTGTRFMYSSDNGTSWTSVSNVAGNSRWQSICYGDGKFVAVASNTNNYSDIYKVAYSTNATNWVNIDVPTHLWQGIAYGNGMFVAVANGGKSGGPTGPVMYSTDAINWTLTPSAVDKGNWLGVTYSDVEGRFVAVGSGNIIMYSDDGINWTLSPSPLNESNWGDVVYGNGKFVAVAVSGTGTRAGYSLTGTGGSTALTFADGTDMSALAAGDTVSQESTTGTVSSITDTTVGLSSSTGAWSDGVDVIGPEKTIVEDNTRLYCVFDSSGNITDLQNNPQNPPYITTDLNPGLTLTFPATFPSGQTPDDELPEGTTLTVEVTAENSSGTSGPVSATVQPEPAGTDALIGGLTTLYTGNGGNRDIVNGINNQVDGGLVWANKRSVGVDYLLSDTLRGTNSVLNSNTGNAETLYTAISAFNTDGFSLASDSSLNTLGDDFVAWNFGKAKGYFDVVKYDGNSATSHSIPHSLGTGTKPGMILIKCISDNKKWRVYHGSMGATYSGILNSTNAFSLDSTGTVWNSTEPTDTDFTVGISQFVNETGNQYIAYLFAEDTPDVIKCGSYVGTATSQDVDCGFKAQWVLLKSSSSGSAGNWMVYDITRGDKKGLVVNGTPPEQSGSNVDGVVFTAAPNGFSVNGTGGNVNASNVTYIYVAIAAPPVARSQSNEEFAETRLKLLSYQNRKEVVCGETAAAERDALIQTLVDYGYTLPEVLEFL